MCSLIPLLPCLGTRLSIEQNMNAQVSHFLRCLIPAGLPNLASLEMDQEWTTVSDTLREYEGSMWYEMPDGKFHEKNPTIAARTFKNEYMNFYDNYIHLIVTGAPNLTDFCLHGSFLSPSFTVHLLNS